MDLRVVAKTGIKNLVIDYIEVINVQGKMFALNWDESEIKRTEDGFIANYYVVNYDDKEAPNDFDALEGMKVSIVVLHSELEVPLDIEIKEMRFEYETPKGNIKKLIFSDVYQTADNEKETKLRDSVIDFVEDETKKAKKEHKDCFFMDIEDESCLSQMAYNIG